MKKEKELEYSRALVPIKKKFYYKIIVCLVLMLGIVIGIINLPACKNYISSENMHEIESSGDNELLDL